MVSGILSKHFSGLHFGADSAKVERKSMESKTFLDATTPYKPTEDPSTTPSSSRKSHDKKRSKVPVVVPSTTYRKRGSGDSGLTRNSATHEISPRISDRSFSLPTCQTYEENNVPRSNYTKQLSLFQSPFDPETAGDQESYRYDVNISYHKNQQKWVEELLLPILEQELGLRCYIHDRDNLPGVSTVKNIAAAVKESRITILCFSRDYLVSSWQNYEALLAHHLDPGGWKKRTLPIVVENCSLPFKYTVFASLKWPECNNTETVPASVRLRRRFFIFGLMNALGMQNKERSLEIYKKYCGMNVPVVVKHGASRLTMNGQSQVKSMVNQAMKTENDGP